MAFITVYLVKKYKRGDPWVSDDDLVSLKDKFSMLENLNYKNLSKCGMSGVVVDIEFQNQWKYNNFKTFFSDNISGWEINEKTVYNLA